MLKAVLFDLDHTLIDWEAAEPWENYALRRVRGVFEFVNTQVHPLADTDLAGFFSAFAARMLKAWDEGVHTLRAPSIQAVMTDTLRASGVPEDRLDIQAIMQAYNWQPALGERAFPDALEVLPQIRAHGIELGIITNASEPMAWRDRELAATGLLGLFPRCRLAAVDVGVLKPHPDIFECALEMLGIRADEAVFVGDSLEADIRGAQGAGMMAVWRVRPGEDLSGEIVPDGVITTLHDLLPLLDGWYAGWRNGHIS